MEMTESSKKTLLPSSKPRVGPQEHNGKAVMCDRLNTEAIKEGRQTKTSSRYESIEMNGHTAGVGNIMPCLRSH